jgi:hypothetical protein
MAQEPFRSFLSLLFVFNHDCATDPNFEFDLMPGLDKISVLSLNQRSL